MDLGQAIGETLRTNVILPLIRHSLSAAESSQKKVIVCSACKKIKLSRSIWVLFDKTVEKVFLDQISHSICPECAKILYPDLDLYDEVS